MEGLDLSKSMISSSKLTGQKAKYTGADVSGWVDVVMGAWKSLSIASVFSEKQKARSSAWE